ncbi:MAG: NAD-dependent epimerase/dehydratase family protein [Chloroflexi bacterium]|nr:NAD-dependent epimerase/dehydratase family protein [Chloroflexota bacterium]
MAEKTILVTGSSGLIGSEAVSYFDRVGHKVLGMDNNMRADFFGPKGDTTWNLKRLVSETQNFEPFNVDIRDRKKVSDFFKANKIDAVIHTAAQPSHDLAASRPYDDFDVNAVGTLNLLEATRNYAADSPFILMSTNKVYGDAPNELPLVELDTRWEYANPDDSQGIDETLRIDQSKHSLFGASKAAADILTQEYGRYFGMPTASFRGGCLTGPNHSGVELHGFLSYLVKVAVTGGKYTIFGYKGKQVRDQIHSHDVVAAFEAFMNAPRPGEVYNLGGGKANSASILESMQMIEAITGEPPNYEYNEQNRAGDHICYYSNLAKIKSHYPDWEITRSLEGIVRELVEFESLRSKAAA